MQQVNLNSMLHLHDEFQDEGSLYMEMARVSIHLDAGDSGLIGFHTLGEEAL